MVVSDGGRYEMACTWKGQIRRDWRDSDEIKDRNEGVSFAIAKCDPSTERKEMRLSPAGKREKGKKLIVPALSAVFRLRAVSGNIAVYIRSLCCMVCATVLKWESCSIDRQ